MSWNFDARAVEPGSGFEIWPDGWWPVVITGAEEKPNQGDDPGMTWHLSIKGLDGPVKDKKGTIQIAHKSGNQQRMDIAMKTMSAICHVTNVLAFQHPGQLANIPFLIKSGTRKGKGKGDNSDKVYQDWADFKNMAGETALEIYKRNNGQGGGQMQQPQQGGSNWGGQPQQPAQPSNGPGAPGWQQGQPAPGGAPQGGGWPQQSQPAQQPQQPQAGQWGGQPQQGQPMQPQGGQPPAQGGWGGGQPTQPAQPQQPQQTWQPGPQGGAPAAGAAPWGAPPQQ